MIRTPFFARCGPAKNLQLQNTAGIATSLQLIVIFKGSRLLFAGKLAVFVENIKVNYMKASFEDHVKTFGNSFNYSKMKRGTLTPLRC